MKYGLETFDAWLHGIQSFWARFLLYWVCTGGVAFLLGGGADYFFWLSLPLGMLDIESPFFLIGTMAAAWLLVRLVLFDTATSRDLLSTVVITMIAAASTGAGFSWFILIPGHLLIAALLFRNFRIAYRQRSV